MKRYIQGSDPTIRVPMREIALTDGTSHTVYDTSGPYTDPSVDVDVRTRPAAVTRTLDRGARRYRDTRRGRPRFFALQTRARSPRETRRERDADALRAAR